jgi:hypothetical protein
MSRKVASPMNFIREYRPEPGTYAERLAAFLFSAREKLPYRFIDVPNCAKIALGLSKVPGENSKDLSRFKSVLSSANTKMIKLYGCEIVSDRLDGLRATVDTDDLVETKHRKKRRRVKLAVASLKVTDDLIDPSKLKSPELKKELNASRRSLAALDSALAGLPLLPPKKE